MEESQLHIPEGWEGKELGILYLEKRKSKFKVSDATNYGGIPFYTSGDAVLEHNEIQTDGENIFLATGGIANVKFHNGKVAYSTDTYVIVGKENISTQFLYFKILDQLYYINTNYFQGSGLKHLQKKDFRKHLCALPKTEIEQTTIANILSKTDQAIANTEALIAKYTRIKTGLMQDLLTKGIDENGNIRTEQTHEFKDSPLGRIPKEWECVEIGSITKSLVPGRNKPKVFNGDIPWITTPDFDGIYLEKSKSNLGLTKEEIKKCSNKIIPANSVVMTCVGELGICAVNLKEITINQQLHSFVPNEKSNPYFLMFIISNSKQYFQKIVATNVVPYMNKKNCESILVVSTDIEEQNRIVEILIKADENIEKSKTELSKLQSLKTGLMQDLLSGKVRVNNLMTEKQN